MLMSFRSICSREKDERTLVRTQARWKTWARRKAPAKYITGTGVHTQTPYNFNRKHSSLCNFDGRQKMKSGWWVAGALTSLRIFQHHPQKSFRLDQKYFETFIILGTGPFVYICISFVATVTLAPGTLLITCNMYLVFVHTVRKWCESAKAQKLRQRCEDGKDRQRERASAWDFCVYRCHFLATEVISMAKLHSQINLDVEVFVRMDGWMLKMPFEYRSRIACNLCLNCERVNSHTNTQWHTNYL